MTDREDWRRAPWKFRYETMAKAASTSRRLGLLATHRHVDVVIDRTALLGPGFGLRLLYRGAFRVDREAEFRRNFMCEIADEGRVSIGARTVFTGMSMIQCSTSVHIAADAMIGQGCLIADGVHRFRDYTQLVQHQGYNFRPIDIGAGAVLHTNCIVINDIGERAVVGANSVVSKSIPAFCVAVGAPARVVEYFGPPERREELLGDAYPELD